MANFPNFDTFQIYELWLLKFSAINILVGRFWEMNPDIWKVSRLGKTSGANLTVNEDCSLLPILFING